MNVLRVSECHSNAIVSQLTKYGFTHSVCERARLRPPISFHSCLQREIFPDLFTLCIRCLYSMSDDVCRPHDSDATIRSDYIRWIFGFLFSLAGNRRSCSTFLVLSAHVLLTKNKASFQQHTFSSHSTTAHNEFSSLFFFWVETKTIVFGNWCQKCSQGSRGYWVHNTTIIELSVSNASINAIWTLARDTISKRRRPIIVNGISSQSVWPSASAKYNTTRHDIQFCSINCFCSNVSTDVIHNSLTRWLAARTANANVHSILLISTCAIRVACYCFLKLFI